MPARLANITFDCADALLLGTFWAEVLGRPLDPGSDSGFTSFGSGDPSRREAAWLFEKVPESKVAKNRQHLDLVDGDADAVERLVALGATVMAEREIGNHGWTVMQDPEGNEFCISKETYGS
jgi:predicted enzyme related to lactoylglutathione lyase